MHLHRVDLNLFVVFECIYTERNLTRAAEQLHVTQPAISNALKRLRETYGDPLFVRGPDGMKPTPVADNLIGRVRQALELLGDSLQRFDHFEPQSATRDFRISMSDLAEALFLPGLMHSVSEQAPGVSLRSFYVPRSDVALELASGKLDLAIEPPLLSDPQLASAPLSRDHYVCVLRQGHPLAESELTLEHYLSLSHLHLSSRRRGVGLVDQALKALGERRRIALRAQHYMVAPLIVANTDLALSLPSRLASGLGLVVKPLPFDVPSLQMHLFWHNRLNDDPASQWLRQRIFALGQSDPEQ